jgi:transcriptional repressor NrdR
LYATYCPACRPLVLAAGVWNGRRHRSCKATVGGTMTPMICPYCSVNQDRVIDSRLSDGGRVVRRRRECEKCGRRFTTYERAEPAARLVVVKRDGTRVPFNPENVYRGVQAACGKRAVPEEVKRRLVEEVEEELSREFEREVSSRVIGERVMARLREVDPVAYVRFASEYHSFELADIAQTVEELGSRPKDPKDQRSLFNGEGT